MPVTTLDPVTALIVVDLQKALLGYPTLVPITEIAERAGELAKSFRAHGLPVVLVNAAGRAPGRTEGAPPAGGARPAPAADGLDILPELDEQSDDIRITKRTWGSFTGTDLDEQLKKRAVTQVVVVGVATSAGVESTARHAHEHGYNVTLATDAMTDSRAEVHQNSVTSVFPRIGETGTTADILALLAERDS